MNLWPFSKKPKASDDSFELPAGVVLASADNHSVYTPMADESAIEAAGHPEEVRLDDEKTWELSHSILPQPIAPPSCQDLDAFTPSATPEVGSFLSWGDTVGQTEPGNSSLQPPLPSSLPPWMEPSSPEAFFIDPVAESFALGEASLPPELSANPIDTNHLELEHPPEVLEPGLSPVDNVVPFPIRQPQNALEDHLLETLPTEGIEWGVAEYSEPETLLSFDSTDFSLEIPDPSATLNWNSPVEAPLPLIIEESGDDWSLPPVQSEAEMNDIQAEAGFFGSYEETSEEPVAFDGAVYDLAPNLLNDRFDNDILPSEACEEIGDSEDISVNLSPGEWDSYDMGHYEDPDEALPLLLLGEASLKSATGAMPFELNELVEPLVLPASETDSVNWGVTEDACLVSPEPSVSAEWEEWTTPVEPPVELKQTDNMSIQGEVVASSWIPEVPQVQPQVIIQPVHSMVGSMHSFAQQVLWEESRAIKRSIDGLVAGYFASQKT